MKTANTNLKQFILSLLIVFSLNSCRTSIEIGEVEGNGTIVTETRTITEKFDKISVSSGIKVLIEQSNTTSIEVETDENIQSLIITQVENGLLIIKAKESYDATKTPLVRVSMPYVMGLKSSSGSSIESKNTLKSTALTVESSSGSDIEIEVEADYIALDASSGSTILAKGKALKAETSSSSGSTINAGELLTNDVISDSSSGSVSKVHPIVSLTAKASSGSEIIYKNVPKNLEKSESSGGSISSR